MNDSSPSGSHRETQSLFERLKPHFSFLFELDSRNLGLFRIIFGAMCLTDLWLRLPHLQMMYASSGWMPSHRVLWYASTKGQEAAHPFSLLYMFNTTPMITLFFYGAMLCVFCFMIGYRTRLFQFLSALCMISVHTRTNVLHNGGDIVHNLWWMWAVWLPLGQTYSVDGLLKSVRSPLAKTAEVESLRVKRGDQTLFSIVILGILMNLSFCYYLNGVHKNSMDWINGSAVPYVLEQDRILTTLGAWSREYIPLWGLRSLSWLTLIAESTGPLFLMLPLYTRRVHFLTLSVVSIALFHMVSTAPFTLTILILLLIGALYSSDKLAPKLEGTVHIGSTFLLAVLIFLLTFPLWLAALMGASYAVAVAMFFRMPPELRITWSRRVVLLGLGGFHVSAGLTMNLGFFSWWMLASYFLLLRGEDWAFLSKLFKPSSAALNIDYPRGDAIAHRWARVGAQMDQYQLITWRGDSRAESSLSASIHEGEGTEEASKITGEVAVIAQVLKRLPFCTPLAWVISVKVIGRPLITAIKWLSTQLISPELVSEEDAERPLSRLQACLPTWRRTILELGAALCFIVALFAVLQGNKHFKSRHSLRLKGSLKEVSASLTKSIDGEVKRVFPSVRKAYLRAWRPALAPWMSSFITYGNFYQGWGMFTNVPKTDGWMIFEATLSDGRVLDMRTGEPPSYQVADYRNRSWGFYEARFGLKLLQRSNLRPLVASWASRSIPRMRLSSQDRVDVLRLYWVSDTSPRPVSSGFRPPKFKEKKLIHEWNRKTP